MLIYSQTFNNKRKQKQNTIKMPAQNSLIYRPLHIFHVFQSIIIYFVYRSNVSIPKHIYKQSFSSAIAIHKRCITTIVILRRQVLFSLRMRMAIVDIT